MRVQVHVKSLTIILFEDLVQRDFAVRHAFGGATSTPR